MIDQNKRDGSVPGDIQQGRQRKAQSTGYGIGQNIPGVTETTNAQGNRSFGGHRQAPKPGGIDVDLSPGTQLQAGRLPSTGKTDLPAMADQQRRVETTNAFQRWETPKKVVNAGVQSLGIMKDLAGAAVAVPADAARNTTIRWAGGDPVTTAGGATQEQDRAFGALQSRLQAFNPSEGITNLKGGILEATGAQPAASSISPNSSSAHSKRNLPGRPQATSQDAAISQTVGGKTGQPGRAEPAGSFGLPGITMGINAEGVRSFTGGGGVGANHVNAIDMGITEAQRTGRSGVTNPGFEKALAAGDYETALQSVNRGDTSQMTRLGQLQGQLRQQRDLRAAAAADRNYSGANADQNQARQKTEAAMIANAKRLSDEGFSKGALRNVQAANTVAAGKVNGSNLGIASRLSPAEISTQNDYAKQQAEADVAQAQASQARTGQQQQGILQGLLEQMNSPDVSDEQRQSLIQRYQALSGDKGTTYDSRVVDQYDQTGNPIGQTLYTINQRTGQAQAVNGNQSAPDPRPPQNHIDALINNPSQAAMFDAKYGEGAAAQILGAQ